jgi:hypothetical protein
LAIGEGSAPGSFDGIELSGGRVKKTFGIVDLHQ